MFDWVLDYEGAIRLTAFIAIFAVMAGLEALRPKRKRALGRSLRWLCNLGMTAINSVLLRLTLPILAVGAAVWAERAGFGLFNQTDLPPIVEFVAAIILLDLVIYGQHVAFHRVPVLWRLHKVHHADRDVDASTALRFHPIEIILSMGLKLAVVPLIGAAPAAVILFEVILNGMAMFNHANLALPAGIDRALRMLVVTPDMHRVHHSIERDETDSNYGFNLSLWDRLFGTYRPQPRAGHTGMEIGLPAYRTEAPAHLLWSLGLPFRRDG